MRACGRSIWVNSRVNSEVNLGQFWSILRKPHGNLSETSWKPHGNLIKHSELQSNGRANLNIQVKPAWDVLRAGLTMCSDTPRFSYRCPNMTVPVTPTCTAVRASDGCSGRGMVRGGYSWVGGAGVIPVHPARCRGEVPDQRSGPRKPCRGWSGWVWELGRDGAWGRPWYHPSGPVGDPSPPCTRTSRICPSWPIRATFDLISYKVSQNREVSSVFVNKACHSP